MPSYSDNDDDLFEESTNSSTDSSSFHDLFAHSNYSSDTFSNSFVESTKDILSPKSIDSDQFRYRTGIVTSFYEVCNRFSFANDNFLRVEYDYLNSISNNHFSKLLYFAFLEESIIKRFSIQNFLRVVIETDNSKVFKEAAEQLKINVDDFFIRVYFGSIYKLLNHAIDRNIAIYEKLCTELQRPPMQAILDKNYDSLDITFESPSSYILRSFDSIKESLGFKTF